MRSWLPDNSFFGRVRDLPFYASFSGGADSTALILILRQWGIPFTAVHFTHGIRDAATGSRELDFCRTFCVDRDIPFLHRDLHVPERRMKNEGLEEAARRCRLEAWHEIIPPEQRAVSAVLTAHHGDDVRENLLLRLFRGGNASSLTGLREESVVEGIRFLRPLLRLGKKDLKDFLARSGVTEWNEDVTNAGDEAARNFLRNRILPLIGERLAFAPGGILASASVLAQDAAFLEETAARTAAESDLADPSVWQAMHPAIRIRVLRLWLSKEAGETVIPDRRTAERFESFLALPVTRRLRKMPVAGTNLRITLAGKRIGTVREDDEGSAAPADRE